MLTPDHCFIKHRRNGSTIYRCPDFTHYLKTGTKNEIEHEVLLYNKIKTYGFPLPTIIAYDLDHDTICRMKEEVVTGKLYADIFTQDCSDYGCVLEPSLETYMVYQQHHLICQSKTENNFTVGDESGFSPVWQKLYDENNIDHNLLDEVRRHIVLVTTPLKQVRNHGDHNPYNIFENGLIDLEDAFVGPMGYDTITAITQNYWFPVDNCIFTQQHRFSAEQIQMYLEKVGENAIDFLDPHIFGALTIMRGVFVTVDTDDPVLRNFRVQKLKDMMECYINNPAMIFQHFFAYYRTRVI